MAVFFNSRNFDSYRPFPYLCSHWRESTWAYKCSILISKLRRQRRNLYPDPMESIRMLIIETNLIAIWLCQDINWQWCMSTCPKTGIYFTNLYRPTEGKKEGLLPGCPRDIIFSTLCNWWYTTSLDPWAFQSGDLCSCLQLSKGLFQRLKNPYTKCFWRLSSLWNR